MGEPFGSKAKHLCHRPKYSPTTRVVVASCSGVKIKKLVASNAIVDGPKERRNLF